MSKKYGEEDLPVGVLVALGRWSRSVTPWLGKNLDGATGGRDGLFSALGEGVSLHRDTLGRVATTKNLD